MTQSSKESTFTISYIHENVLLQLREGIPFQLVNAFPLNFLYQPSENQQAIQIRLTSQHKSMVTIANFFDKKDLKNKMYLEDLQNIKSYQYESQPGYENDIVITPNDIEFLDKMLIIQTTPKNYNWQANQ